MSNRDELLIWDGQIHGLPSTFRQAVELAEVLRQTTEPDNAKKKSFIEALNKAKELDGIMYRPESTAAAFRIHLPVYYWQSAVKHIVNIAMTHQLVVLFDNESLLFLPNGDIIPSSNIHRWQEIVNAASIKRTFPNTMEGFYRLLLDRVQPLLANYDFNLQFEHILDYHEYIATFVRFTEYGTQEFYLYCSVREEEGVFNADFTLNIYSKAITTIYNQFGFSDIQDISSLSAGGSFDNPHEVVNKKDLAQRLFYLESSFLKYANLTKTLNGLNTYKNSGGVGELFHKGAPYNLIVAKLAGNIQYFTALAAETQYYPEQWQQFVAVVNAIDPEQFWQEHLAKLQQEKQCEYLRIQELQNKYHLSGDDAVDLTDQWYDPDTELVWQRCFYGQKLLDGQLIVQNPYSIGLSEALFYAKKIHHLGWRIPLEHEVIDLVAKIKADKTLKPIFLGEKQSINAKFLAQSDEQKDKLKTLELKNGEFVKPRFTGSGYLRLVKSVKLA